MARTLFSPAANGPVKTWQRMLRKLLPKDRTFWKVYAPVIRILRDSREHQLIREKMSKYLDLGKEDVVLEEGCGRGIWLAEITGKVRYAVGLDVDPGMIKAAWAAAPQADFVRHDLNQGIPFRNESFSRIGSILVEGYLRNREIARAERFRVLQPGGMLAIVTPRRGAKFFKVLKAEARQRKEERTVIENLKKLPLAIIAIIFGKIAELKAVVGDWHFYEKDELADFYRSGGFEIVACEPVYADQAWLLIVRKPSIN